ncbi:aldose 1-epimerase [Massilia sp. TSP1-1-2]|uniref:aldose 1-epimerase n=1 Tax=Massilia sp. TSP1-1-2 TaxID=2804649 RepID=UPI003CF0DB7A
MDVVTLRNAHLHAQVLPAIGGALARLDALAGGHPRTLLRPCELPAGAPDPTPSQLACFPLVPWSNRIGDGGFHFDGRRIDLAPNRAGEPFPIHGEGWQQPWQVVSRSNTSVALLLDRGGQSPFSYVARLCYALRGPLLEVTLEVRNDGNYALPFGLGLHPWLPRTEGVLLRAAARSVWRRGEDGLPSEPTDIPIEWDFSGARPLPEQAIDNVFSGWDGVAEIFWPESAQRLKITADMGYYIVYTRPGADFFCFEPVDHMINAHNLEGGPVRHGLSVLAPGQSLTRTVRFEVLAESMRYRR